MTVHLEAGMTAIRRDGEPAAKPGIEWGKWTDGPVSADEWAMQIERIGPNVRHRIPADRPRAAHKLNLQEEDVVELVAWQDGRDWAVGRIFKFDGLDLRSEGFVFAVPSVLPKGHRPLFRVISSAADAKPDEVIVRYARLYLDLGALWIASATPDCTHRFTIAFPHGSDIGMVTREKL